MRGTIAMFDENNPIRPQDPEIRPQDPETPAETPAVPQESPAPADNPEWEEPEEIVSWYTPKEPEGREVVNYYVQRTPMPQSVWKQAAKKEKRRSRLWLWISLAVVAVTVAAVVLNRVKSPSFPNTIAGVVYQAGAFDAVYDGQINLTPDSDSIRAAKDALNGWDPTGGCLYYYNPSTATNGWIWTRTVQLSIGKHNFAI